MINEKHKLINDTIKNIVDIKLFFFFLVFTSQEGRYFEDTAPKPMEVNGDIKSIRAIASANIPNDNVESKRLCTKYNFKKT